MTTRKNLLDNTSEIPIERQCKLLDVNRSTYYYEPIQPTAEAVEYEEYVKSRIDFWNTWHPSFGVRMITAHINAYDDIYVGKKLIKRLMREMGITAIYPKYNLSKRNHKHKKHPYLVRKNEINRPNQVWAIDITYIKMGKSHMYLIAVIDWYGRFIVGQFLSDSLDVAPIIETLKVAFATHGLPEMINSDQGSQFTSDEYVNFLRENGIIQSMDAKGAWIDNIMIERWFRTLKYEDIFLNEYRTPRELRIGINNFVNHYNFTRLHTSLGDKTPASVYKAKCTA